MEKSKVKLFSITLVTLLIILNFTFLGVDAVSDTVPYEIPELAMTMDIPSSIKIITQGIKQSDPIFSTENFAYIQTMSKLRDNEDYFYGKDIKTNFEFEVKLTENENKIENFTKLSEKKQNSILETFSQQPNIIESSFYKTNSTVYLVASRCINNSDGRFFTKEYYTIYNSYDITVKLSSSSDNLTNQELEILKAIVDSIRFQKEKVVNLSEVLSKSELFSFCFIIISFLILVIAKIKNIKKEKYRAERRQNRIKQRMERDEKEKQVVIQQSPIIESNEIEQKFRKAEAESIKEKNEKSEIKTESKSTEIQNILNTQLKESNSNLSNSDLSIAQKQEPEIDLEEAIANFGNLSNSRKEHRESKKKTKKSKLPFGN